MSHWAHLQRNGKDVEVERHSDGGTYVMGGTTRATLNVTYNYGRIYREVGLTEGLYSLNEMGAEAAIPLLERAVETLGVERDDDYWAATPGNAGYALSILLGWARQYPDATFRVER